MSAENLYWGPNGPQPISPLSFLSLRQYVLDRIQATAQLFLPENAFTWSVGEPSEGSVAITLTPIGNQGFTVVSATVPVIELLRLIGPMVGERTMEFATRPTAAQVIARINELVGVNLLRAEHFLVDGLDYTTFPANVLLRPSASNPFSLGSVQLRITETVTVPIDGLGYPTDGYSVNRETQVDMCIVGSTEPLLASDTTGNRTTYSDGSYIDRIAPDLIEIRSGMIRNYWVRVLIPGFKPSKPVGNPARQVNVALELVEQNSGQITYHVDSPYPSKTLGRAGADVLPITDEFQAFLGFNFSPLDDDPQGVSSAYLQKATVRIRLFKE